MSKHKNVNPDHYKTRGSLRQGEDVAADREKQRFRKKKAESKRAPRPKATRKSGRSPSS
jgi:hypothetical protein